MNFCFQGLSQARSFAVQGFDIRGILDTAAALSSGRIHRLSWAAAHKTHRERNASRRRSIIRADAPAADDFSPK